MCIIEFHHLQEVVGLLKARLRMDNPQKQYLAVMLVEQVGRMADLSITVITPPCPMTPHLHATHCQRPGVSPMKDHSRGVPHEGPLHADKVPRLQHSNEPNICLLLAGSDRLRQRTRPLPE